MPNQTIDQYLPEFNQQGLSQFITSNGTLHNGSELTQSSDTEVTIKTSPQQWDYALTVPVNVSNPDIDEEIQNKIEIQLKLASGAVGIMVVKPDLTTTVVQESIIGAENGSIQIDCKQLSSGDLITFRNVMPGGNASQFSLIDIDVSSAPITRACNPSEEGADDECFKPENLFATLRKKWSEIPAGIHHRKKSAELLELNQDELLTWWKAIYDETTKGQGHKVRGWYHTLYKDFIKGKSVADIGSGLGIDGLFFAMNGAHVTFVDISKDNLKLIEHICKALEVDNVEFIYLDNFGSLEQLKIYDVIWCNGSMINAPFNVMKKESDILLKHLKQGGRWIELCYPKERWIRDGQPPFSLWGDFTDGEGTPWVEWYDLDKLLKRMDSAKFKIVLSMNYHDNDFNWFDLEKE